MQTKLNVNSEESQKNQLVELDQNNINALVEPVIISASRATDIPKWYAEWFINRLNEGYVIWINPFNQNFRQKVSFEKTKAIVFWTKDPRPLMKYLPIVDKKGIDYYFQYTLNDYEKENIEPNLSPLNRRIETFKELSNQIGKNKVIWRFDPLVLSDEINVETLLNKIKNVGDQIHEYTEKLVISFIDISEYHLVKQRLNKLNKNYREFTPSEMLQLAEGLYTLNKEWGLILATCAEDWPKGTDLSKLGIVHNRCIDDELLKKLFPNNHELIKFLESKEGSQKTILESSNNKKNPLKDKNQRDACGCIISKDIGQYETCMHLCTYCYANKWDTKVRNRYERYCQSDRNGESIN
jgi:DNA repair photolyase